MSSPLIDKHKLAVEVYLSNKNLNSDVISTLKDIYLAKTSEKIPEPSDINMVLLGMQNPGLNVCWFNSTLQAITNIIPFRRYLLNNEDKILQQIEKNIAGDLGIIVSGGNHDKTTRGFIRFVREKYQQEKAALKNIKVFQKDPHALHKSICHAFPQFIIGHQHDASEFVNMLLVSLITAISPTMELEDNGTDPISRFFKINTEGKNKYAEKCDLPTKIEQFKLPLLFIPFPDDEQTNLLLEYKLITPDLRERLHAAWDGQPYNLTDLLKTEMAGEVVLDTNCLNYIIGDIIENEQNSNIKDDSNRSKLQKVVNELCKKTPNFINELNQYIAKRIELNTLYKQKLQQHKNSNHPEVKAVYDQREQYKKQFEQRFKSACDKDIFYSNKSIQITKLPPYLIIALKRTQKNKNKPIYADGKIVDYETYKVNNLINYPHQNLDMKEFIKPGTWTGETKYKLHSVVFHSGGHGGGHFMSYIKIGNKWYWTSDDTVIEVTADRVQDSMGSTSYFFIYQRNDIPNTTSIGTFQ